MKRKRYQGTVGKGTGSQTVDVAWLRPHGAVWGDKAGKDGRQQLQTAAPLPKQREVKKWCSLVL